jgi:predicted transposase/invertase (TIGR01784 family)
MENLTSWEERGMEKGIEQGMEEVRRSIALKMLQENMPIDTIARFTNFSVEQIRQLQAQNGQG